MMKIRKPTLMRSLLWKDFHTLKPLGIAIGLGSITFVSILAALGIFAPMARGEADEIHVFFWFMMPCMMALGAPAMLVGQEEEKGTLQWVRTLPVRWQSIATSKLIVSLLFLAAAWILSSALLFLANRKGFHSSYFVNTMLSPNGIYRTVFYSLAILITGFAMSYMFRSVLVGLFALPVAMAPIAGLESSIGTGPSAAVSDPIEYLRTAVMFLLLIVLYFVYRICARWRLSSASFGSIPVKRLAPKVAYRPPVAIGLSRPSQRNALLWQQARQIAIPLAVLTLISLMALLTNSSRRNRVDPEIMAMVGTLSIWIGGLVFFGDSSGGRRAFFADRGIQPTKVWWTRVLFPFAAMVLVSLVALFKTDELTTPMIFLSCFCLGQFVSLWVSRPIMAFLTGPIYTLIIMFCANLLTGWVWGRSDDAFEICFVVLGPILLFATWRLCKYWIDGESGWRFNSRFIKYSTIAVFVPAFTAIVIVLLITPAANPNFRVRAVSAVSQIPFPTKTDDWSGFSARIAANPHQFHAIRSHEDVLLELESVGPLGQYVCIGEAQTLIRDNDTDIELKLDAMRVLLKFCRQTRQAAIDGHVGLAAILGIAEVSERLIVTCIDEYEVFQNYDVDVIAALVSQIPTQEVRRQSRRIALLRYWNKVQAENYLLWGENKKAAETLRIDPDQYDAIPGMYSPNFGMLRLQLRRSNRLLDAAFAMILDQLENQLPAWDSPERIRRDRLMYACGWLDDWVLSNNLGFQDYRSILSATWTSDFDERIQRLREKYLASNGNLLPDVWL